MVTTTYTNVRANLARYLDQVTDWAKIDRKTALRTFKLIEAIMRDPFAGLGKLAGCRRNQNGTQINAENADFWAKSSQNLRQSAKSASQNSFSDSL